MKNDKNPYLKNKAVLTKDKNIMGLPFKVFVMACFFCLVGSLVFLYIGGFFAIPLIIIFSYVVFHPLILLHKEDQNSWRKWLKMFSSDVYISDSIRLNKHVLVWKSGEKLSLVKLKRSLKSTTPS